MSWKEIVDNSSADVKHIYDNCVVVWSEGSSSLIMSLLDWVYDTGSKIIIEANAATTTITVEECA